MNKWIFLPLGFVLSASLSAGSINYIGTIPIAISSDQSTSLTGDQQTRIIYVQKIHLSDSARTALSSRIDALDNDAHDSLSNDNAQGVIARVNLGMNATPVLDQGAHGSCVTFAITGAFDALIGKGDYISQLCSLELGDYLARRGMLELSGWSGSYGELVLNQLSHYGVVLKSYQIDYGCAGVKLYPLLNEQDTGRPMSSSEYTANSLSLSRYGSWEVLLNAEDAFTTNHNPAQLLGTVKKHLREGKRVTFGMLLDESVGGAGALGANKVEGDTWVITSEIAKRAQKEGLHAGHEMIIIGYDDNATARAQNGELSKGLFIVRNSWGMRAGDKGNYYVSYDYFKAFSDEAQVIIASTP